MKTNPQKITHSYNTFTFLGDEEFDGHFIGYSEECIFMQQPRAYIFTNLKKNI